jgi:hypothetical protein
MLYTLGSQLTEREGTTEDGPPPSEEQYLEFPMYDVRNKLTSVTSATVVFPLAKSVQTLLHDDNIDISLVDRLCNLIKRSRVIWKSKMGCHKICPRCWFGHCPNDWYSYIPECISAERYPQKFLLDAIWSKFVE